MSAKAAAIALAAAACSSYPVANAGMFATAYGIVAVPTTRADDSRDMDMPDTVIAAAPGVMMVPAIERPFRIGCIARPAMVATDGAEVAIGIGIVFSPTTKADPTNIGVPEIMIGGSPGAMIVPAIEIPLETCLISLPSNVVTDGTSGIDSNGVMGVPAMITDGRSAAGVPDIVIGDAPGVIVAPAMATPLVSGIIALPSMVKIGLSAGGPGCGSQRETCG